VKGELIMQDGNHQQNKGTKKQQGTLGTFAGVFTPSILTILGIILFLRLGYVVGSAGLGHALIILLLANCISVLTTISLSAIATNTKVKGGGVYYLISRTLGLEFGGAIGVVLFLAQAISIGFYCIGFGDVLAEIFPIPVLAGHLSQIIAAVAVCDLFSGGDGFYPGRQHVRRSERSRKESLYWDVSGGGRFNRHLFFCSNCILRGTPPGNYDQRLRRHEKSGGF